MNQILQTFPDAEETEIRGMHFLSGETKDIINYFDVSDNGSVAVGLSNYHINIYNENLEFVYGLELGPGHSVQVIGWDAENLIIYRENSVQIECIVIQDKDKATAFDIPRTDDNHKQFQDIYQSKLTSTIENTDYIYCCHDGVLTRQDKQNGTVQIIAQNSRLTEFSWKFSGILFFVGFIVLFLYDEYQRHKPKQDI